MHNKIVNKIRYDDLEKPMKQTSFTLKNWGGNLPRKPNLSLDSIVLVDEFQNL